MQRFFDTEIESLRSQLLRMGETAIRQVRDAVRVPVVAYQVSGEFSLIKAAAARGWIDERAAVLETLTGIRRAGADLIISYFAAEVAQWLA